jgi:hypothetical protein
MLPHPCLASPTKGVILERAWIEVSIKGGGGIWRPKCLTQYPRPENVIRQWHTYRDSPGRPNCRSGFFWFILLQFGRKKLGCGRSTAEFRVPDKLNLGKAPRIIVIGRNFEFMRRVLNGRNHRRSIRPLTRPHNERHQVAPLGCPIPRRVAALSHAAV